LVGSQISYRSTVLKTLSLFATPTVFLAEPCTTLVVLPVRCKVLIKSWCAFFPPPLSSSFPLDTLQTSHGHPEKALLSRERNRFLPVYFCSSQCHAFPSTSILGSLFSLSLQTLILHICRASWVLPLFTYPSVKTVCL